MKVFMHVESLLQEFFLVFGCLIHQSVFISLANGSARSSFTRCIGENDNESKAKVLLFSLVAMNLLYFYKCIIPVRPTVSELDLATEKQSI